MFGIKLTHMASTRHAKRALIVSVSSGTLAYIDLEDSDNEVTEFSAHMYEPWITTFDRSDESGMTVWSGGDDCVLKKWDLEDTTRPIFVNKQCVPLLTPPARSVLRTDSQVRGGRNHYHLQSAYAPSTRCGKVGPVTHKPSYEARD